MGSLPLYTFIIYYCNLNITGKENFTRTGLPLCLPGLHFGIIFKTRSASFDK